MPRRRRPLAAALSALALTVPLVAGVRASGDAGRGTDVSTSAPASAATPESIAAATLAHMTLGQRVGQLFMVGGNANGVPSSTRTAIRRYHVGNVMLTDRSAAGVAATARVTAGLRKLATTAATAGVPLILATDQEGGLVQVLRGPGFATMPAARQQGDWSTARLRRKATHWGTQLYSAGLNANLAPVADTVPSARFAPANDPIGYYDREFGYATSAVSSHSVAFLQGMGAAHIAATAKHFPGLGRVTGNPDVTSHVTDRTTTRTDAYLAPFRAAIAAGVPMVMVSTVYYTRIDPANPAAFSRTVITGLLRGDLGFDRVVISDDLGKARQVAGYSLGARARSFLAAGGDIVLTVLPSTLPAMYNAVLQKAQDDATFRSIVDRAAMRVLTEKARLGLIGN